MEKETTLIIGASTNPARYSNRAIKLFQRKGIPHIALGLKSGKVGETKIVVELKVFKDIHTVTLYIGAKHQDQSMVDFIISLNPKRVIFNPGSENFEHFNQGRN